MLLTYNFIQILLLKLQSSCSSNIVSFQLAYNSMSSTISEEEVVTSTENAKRKLALNTCNESLKKKNGERTTFRKIDPFGSGEFNFFKIPFGVNPFALVPPEVQDFESYTSGYRSTTPNAMTKSLSTPTLTSSSGNNFYAYSIVVLFNSAFSNQFRYRVLNECYTSD